MIILSADKNRLVVRQREPVTSGSVNTYTVQFEFSSDWDGMERVAVFKSGSQAVSVLLDETNECVIPWEVMDPDDKGKTLLAGVHGTRGGSVVLPTIWTSLGVIMEGVTLGPAGSRPPAPDLWKQELARKGDRLDYTESGELALFSGGRLLSAVPAPGGGGEDGTTDHRLLTGRDSANQHPIAAIEGLADELSRIPEPVEALTNFDLEALLK